MLLTRSQACWASHRQQHMRKMTCMRSQEWERGDGRLVTGLSARRASLTRPTSPSMRLTCLTSCCLAVLQFFDFSARDDIKSRFPYGGNCGSCMVVSRSSHRSSEHWPNSLTRSASIFSRVLQMTERFRFQPQSWPGNNIPAPFTSGQEFTVPAATLHTPEGVLGPVKGLLGQRIYNP